MEHTLKTTSLVVLVALLATAAAACGDDDSSTGGGNADSTTTSEEAAAAEPVIDPGDGGDYAPELDPADFVDGVDNPYLPFVPGTTWHYEGVDDGETEIDDVTVLAERKEVLGISAVVVQDTVKDADGNVLEDTRDWYAQDRDGNVWYLGEETAEYEDGEVVSTEGSWEAGVDGAYPGIVMPADPTAGHAYRQEYYAGEAEDLGEILEVGAGPRTVPAGTYENLLVTRDWNPLDPDIVEEKTYAPGIGLIYEVKAQGGDAEVELVTTSATAG
jgi:hypothetical protein